MNRQRGYSEDDRDTPLEWWVTAYDARRKAYRAFAYGAVICGVIGFGAGMAWGLEITGSTVAVLPTDEPGAVAIVVFQNSPTNSGFDDGEYTATGQGITVGVIFDHQIDAVGTDAVTIIPPLGLVCDPADCRIALPEWQSGSVFLREFVGT